MISQAPNEYDAMLDAFTREVFDEYDLQIRLNGNVHPVALDDDGEMGAFGEITDVAREMLYGNRRGELSDALWERLHLRFGEYQTVLLNECQDFWHYVVQPILFGAKADTTGYASTDNGWWFRIEHSDDPQHNTEYHVIPSARFRTTDAPILTVGALRSVLADVPEDFQVLIATKDWYTNVECIDVGKEEDGGTRVVNIFPVTKAEAAGDFDSRQF